MKKIILSIALMLPLIAQEEKKLTLLEQIIQPKITFQTDYLSDAKFENSQASVQTSKQKIQINNGIVGFSYSRWDFEWSDAEDLDFYRGKIPIESMQSLRLYVNYPLPINDEWFMLNMVNISATYEDEYDDAFGAGVSSFFSYKIDDKHSLQIGAFANYHSVKTLVLPVIGYSYRVRERDGLQVVLGFPRAFVGYHLTPKLLLNAGMIYSQAVIRLADDSGIEPQGYIEAKDFQSNIGFRYEVNEHFQLRADMLYAFKRDFNIYNRDAEEIDSYSIEPSLGATVKIQYLF